MQLLTTDGALNCLMSAHSGCHTAPRSINRDEAVCSAVTGYKGALFDIIALSHSNLYTFRRPVPPATNATVAFSLEHICAQNVLPLQRVRCAGFLRWNRGFRGFFAGLVVPLNFAVGATVEVV
jgi:hypothetical protein